MSEQTNPWGLTPRECATLSAAIEMGCLKLAAKKLFVSVKTLEAHIGSARRKMGLHGSAAQTRHLLMWDRHTGGTLKLSGLSEVDPPRLPTRPAEQLP